MEGGKQISDLIIFGYLLRIKKSGEITENMFRILLNSFLKVDFFITDKKEFDDCMKDISEVDVESIRDEICKREAELLYHSYTSLELGFTEMEIRRNFPWLTMEQKEKMRKINAIILYRYGLNNQNGQK